MADEVTTGTEATATEAKEATQAVVETASKAELAELKSMVAALSDTVKGALTPRATQAQAHNAAPGELPSHFRERLRAKGLTDADIDHNAPLIVPWLTTMLETDGAIITGAIQQTNDEVEMVRAATDDEAYPYWKDLSKDVRVLRSAAKKEGRYLSPADAYQAAVANDVASKESKVAAARDRAKATRAEAASNVDVQDVPAQHGSTRRVTRTAHTADDVASMSKDERKAFFEKLGDTPIR